MELDVAQPVLLGPGEGERLNERIVVKLERPEISVNEVNVGPDFVGPGPHFHKKHVDAFYVLEGQLEFTNGTETLLAPAGTSVAVPPNIVHGFTNPGPGGARYLNIHAPDAEFIEYLRHAVAGEEFSWDSYDVDEPYGPAEAIVVGPDDGERLVRPFGLTNTIRAETTQLSLFVLEFDERWEGVDPHHHGDHVDSFFILDGEVDFLLGDETARAGTGTYVAAPPNFTHGFRPIAPARFLNIHAPDAGFAARARGR
ncbi:MAG TPA: cupin domain-containing protein [Gaiellaceae bacterium]|jgi:quercetin dioxygenase-like cupin family protein|nr:cupin domain-containing protein [Gaiellaceae bacterium]